MHEAICGRISPEEIVELHQQNRKPYLLDVREIDEYRTLHATISHLLPLSILSQRQGLDRIDADTDEAVYVICRSGRRSLTACEILHEAGYKKLYNVEGGMEAWRQRKLPFLEGENIDE